VSFLEKLLSERQSIRAFLPRAVSEHQVKSILEQAAMSPSGGNIQPWKTYVLSGKEKQGFVETILGQINMGKLKDETASLSYPNKLKSPYRERRYDCGMALYSALEIDKSDQKKRHEQWLHNYRFFDAPIGILFVMDAQMDRHQYIDLGIYMQTIMLASQQAGLATCAQGSWGHWPETAGAFLSLDETERVVMGLAMGYADMADPVNQYRTEREGVDNQVIFKGFEL